MRNANKTGVIDYEKKAIREFDSYGKNSKKSNFLGRNLLKLMLTENPNDRPSATEVLEHKYLSISNASTTKSRSKSKSGSIFQ